MKNVLFSSWKCAKNKISWNIKTKCVTDFLLTVRSSSMNDYTCYYVERPKRHTFKLISIKKWDFLIFYLQVNGYLNTKESFPICMFVVMASGKCHLHILFTFLQGFLHPHIRKNLIFFSHNICRDVQQSIFVSR